MKRKIAGKVVAIAIAMAATSMVVSGPVSALAAGDPVEAEGTLGEENPVDKPEGEAPTDKPEEEAPADKPEGEAPADKPEGEAPTDKPEEEAPVETPSEEKSDGTKEVNDMKAKVSELLQTIKIEKNGVVYIKFLAREWIEKLTQYGNEIRITIIGTANINEWMGNITP